MPRNKVYASRGFKRPFGSHSGGAPAQIDAPWNVEWLKNAEMALLREFRNRSTLTIPEFIEMARKLTLPQPISQEPTMFLSREERLLVDLLSCASPQLYRLEDSGLRKVRFEGNRMEILLELASVKRISKDKRQNAIMHMRKLLHRQKSKNMTNSAESTETKPKSTSDILKLASNDTLHGPEIREDMTIEERVQARADARQALKKKAGESELHPKQHILKLADAIHAHSQSALQYQDKMALLTPSKKRKNHTSGSHPFVMTLKTMVQTFGEKSNTRTVSRKELVQMIKHIQRETPEWISIENDDPLGKNKMVWIHPGEYAAARAKLGGRSIGVAKEPASSAGGGTSLNDMLNKVACTQRQAAQGQGRSALRPSENRRHVSHQPYEVQRQRTPTWNGQVDTAGSKRQRPFPTEDLLLPNKKKRKSLRINNNLIITDADYDGGEIIQPTMHESPRGLKRLFYQMNTGQRI